MEVSSKSPSPPDLVKREPFTFLEVSVTTVKEGGDRMKDRLRSVDHSLLH